MEMILQLLFTFWQTTVQMAPWLLFGFLFAGLLSLFFTPEFVARHLGQKAGRKAVFLSVLLGVPLPLCSCGVLPVAVGLHKSGASKGATAAFLISTPQTGIDSFFATYSLLGWVFALIRPLVAFITGILGGLWINAVHPAQMITPVQTTTSDPQAQSSRWRRLPSAFAYGYGTLLGNVSGALFIGLLLSTLISYFVPNDFFNRSFLGSDWVAFPIMLLIGIPMYVCSTASIPVALSLILKGISPGAALIFLIVGPALNGASLTTLLKLLGKKSTCIHLFVISLSAVLAGLLINYLATMLPLLPATSTTEVSCCDSAHTIAGWQYLCGALLLLLLAYHLLYKMIRRSQMTHCSCCSHEAHPLLVTVKGMMCDHCRGMVQKLLTSYASIQSVKQVAPDTFAVEGTLPDSLATDIEQLGFELVKETK